MGSVNLTPEEAFDTVSDAQVLVLACGALAREILQLFEQLGATQCDIRCLPASLHNTPEKIPELLRQKLEQHHKGYTRIFVAYADCGTGGLIDTVLAEYPNAVRLVGSHCYATYSGQNDFAVMMDEELGSFFLTDYMVRHFDALIIKGMGLDRHPQLREMYFGNYRRVVYLAQIEDKALYVKAEQAAATLGLAFEYRYTGMGELEQFIQEAAVQ